MKIQRLGLEPILAQQSQPLTIQVQAYATPFFYRSYRYFI